VLNMPPSLKLLTFSIVFCLNFFFSIDAIFAQEGEAASLQSIADVDGVTVVADTRARDRLYGASIRVDVGRISLSQLKELRLGYGPTEDIFAKKGEPLEVVVLVPARELEFAKKNYIPLVEAMFKERYETDRVRARIVTINVDEVAIAEEQARAELEHLRESLPNINAEEKELITAMEKKNRRMIESLYQWRNQFQSSVRRISNDYEVKSMAMASVMGMASSVAPVAYWMTTVGMDWFGLGLIMTTVAYDQINTTFAGKLIHFENEHRLPGENVSKLVPFSNGNRPIKAIGENVSRLIRFYNGNTAIKAMAVNFGIGAATGFLFRSLNWGATPDAIPGPLSMDFLATLGGMNFVSSIFTAGGDVGLHQLRKRGYITSRMEVLTASTFNLTAQLNNLLLGSGFTEFLPYGLALEWAPKAAIFALGKLLPTRKNRFFLIMPGLDKESVRQVRQVYDLQDSLSHTDLDSDKFRDMLKDFDADVKWTERVSKLWGETQKRIETIQEKWSIMWQSSCARLKSVLRKG
jgi:hypothetical protein